MYLKSYLKDDVSGLRVFSLRHILSQLDDDDDDADVNESDDLNDDDDEGL